MCSRLVHSCMMFFGPPDSETPVSVYHEQNASSNIINEAAEYSFDGGKQLIFPVFSHPPRLFNSVSRWVDYVADPLSFYCTVSSSLAKKKDTWRRHWTHQFKFSRLGKKIKRVAYSSRTKVVGVIHNEYLIPSMASEKATRLDSCVDSSSGFLSRLDTTIRTMIFQLIIAF